MGIRKMRIVLVIILSLLLLSGCTENERAKMYGGTAKIYLEPGEKLVNVTWKDADLWYLTKPMNSNDVPETYTFVQESNFGIMKGKVIIIERR